MTGRQRLILFAMACFTVIGMTVVACGEGGDPPTVATTDPNTIRIDTFNSTNYIKLVTFDDGTKCVVYIGTGLDCNFAPR